MTSYISGYTNVTQPWILLVVSIVLVIWLVNEISDHISETKRRRNKAKGHSYSSRDVHHLPTIHDNDPDDLWNRR